MKSTTALSSFSLRDAWIWPTPLHGLHSEDSHSVIDVIDLARWQELQGGCAKSERSQKLHTSKTHQSEDALWTPALGEIITSSSKAREITYGHISYITLYTWYWGMIIIHEYPDKQTTNSISIYIYIHKHILANVQRFWCAEAATSRQPKLLQAYIFQSK